LGVPGSWPAKKKGWGGGGANNNYKGGIGSGGGILKKNLDKTYGGGRQNPKIAARAELLGGGLAD